MSIRQFIPNGGILEGFRQIADFGANYIDPFLPNEAGRAELTLENFKSVSDSALNDLYSLITVGLIGPFYTWTYLFPEQAAAFLFSDEIQAKGGFSLPWKPFEYMQNLVDVVPKMNAVGASSLWEEQPRN